MKNICPPFSNLPTFPQQLHLVLGSLPPLTCQRTAEPELQRLMVLSVGRGTNRYASVLEGESEHINANQLAVFSIIQPSSLVIYDIFCEVVRLRVLFTMVIQIQGLIFCVCMKSFLLKFQCLFFVSTNILYSYNDN